MKDGLSIDTESIGDQLAIDIQAVTRHRDRIEAVLRQIGYAPEAQGREKLLELYQALPQIRVLAATYAVPLDEIRRVTRSSTLSEDERKEFLNLADRLRGLYNIPQRLKEVLPDLFHVPTLRRSPLNLSLELHQLDDKSFVSRLSGEGVTIERRFEVDPAILEEARLIQQAAENQERLPPHTAENLGRRLGRSALGAHAIEAVLRAVGEGRRVRIFLPPASTALLPLPWETLLRGSDLAKLLPNVAIVRGSPAATSVPLSLPPVPPLRVLLILSSPLDVDPQQEIQVERERERMTEPLRPFIARGQIRLKVLDAVSRRQIREALGGGFHVVHFIGHGLEGGLLIEDEAGNSQMIPAPDFASLFTEGRPAMVWLTACRSAVSTQPDAHGSVAEALAAIGIPAVVAMRYSLTYDAGRRLGEALYQAIADGKPPEEALESARNAVFLADVKHVWADWTIPALFSHSASEASFEWQEDAQLTRREDWLSGLNRVDQGFVGRRSEIRRTKEALTRGGHRVVVIQGLPGIGKSVLASRVIEDLQGEFDGIFSRTVLRDAETKRPNLDFLGLLRELDYFLRRHGISSLSEAATHEEWPIQLKLQHLHTALQARFLIVLDSVEDLLDSSLCFEDRALEGMLKEILGAGPQSRFLLIARVVPHFPQEERYDDRLKVVSLGALKDHEARELFSLRTEARQLPTTDAEKLLTRAQGIPLALVSYLALARERDRLGEILASPVEVTSDPATRAIADLVRQLPPPLRQAGARVALFRGPAQRAALRATRLTSAQIDDLTQWSLLLHIRDADLYTMHPHVRLHLSGILDDNDRRETHTAIATYLAKFHRQFAKEYEKAQKDPTQSGTWLARTLHLAPSGSTVDIALEEHYHRRAAGDEEGSAALLAEMAEHLFTTGRLYELNSLLQQTPESFLARKTWMRTWQARVWLKQGQWDDAFHLLELIRSDSSADSGEKIAAAFDIAWIAQNRGDYNTAESSYRGLLDAYPDKDEVKTVAYHQLGTIHQARGDYSAALSWYQRSLALKGRLGDQPGIASSYHQIGTIHEDQGNYAAALDWYHKSLAISERLRDLAAIARSYHQIGMIHEHQGDYPAASEWYQKSLGLLEGLGDLPGIAASYHQLGTIHLLKSDYPAALEWYQKSLRLKERWGDQPGIASSYHQIGMIHQHLGDYRAAEEWYRKSLSIEERVGNLSGIASSYHQIGMIHQHLGDYRAAEEWYRKALALQERLGNMEGIARCSGQLGILYARNKDYKEAIRYTHTAVLLSARIGSPIEDLARSVMRKIIDDIGEEEFKTLLTEVVGQQTKEETVG